MGKFFLNSKTVQGLIAAGIAFYAPAIQQKTGILIDDAATVQLASQIVAGLGLAYAGLGRVLAKGPLTLLPKS